MTTTDASDRPIPSVVGLSKMREPFPPHHISKLPKPYKAESPRGTCGECGGYHALPAMHLDYVGHAALTDRLLDVDPRWTWEPMATTPEGLPLFDAAGGLWIRLTVLGMTRLGYGSAGKKTEPGAREKEVIGDALRNAAMRFGAALDLWHRGQLHEPADEEPEKPKAQAKPKAARPAAAPARPQPPEGAAYIDAVNPKKHGQVTWDEVVASTGETFTVRAAGLAALAVGYRKSGQLVRLVSHQNAKGHAELDAVALWTPDAEPAEPLTAADVNFTA